MTKVLMLGWEFPPFVNGGLGVASHGLAEALSPHIDLNILVPRADSSDVAAKANINILGLNKVDLKKLWKETTPRAYDRLRDVRLAYVDVHLAGYERVREETYPDPPALHSFTVERFWQLTQKTRENPVHNFNLKELYGDDLFERIREYSNICLRISQTLDFDIVHAHDWMTFLAALEIKSHRNCPLVLHVHSLEYDRNGPERKGWVYQLERHAMEEADAIIPVSEYTAQIIGEHYQIPGEKIFPVHNAIKPEEKVRKKPVFPDKLVVFMGRLAMQKGPHYFFDAAYKVLEQMDGVRFIMAGSGQEMPQIIERVSKARIGDKFHFTGHLSPEKARHLLSMTDVFVMPSESEPFGLVAIEAAQMGVPLIISNNSGAAEVLPNALSTDPGDTDKIAGYIISLLKHPNLAKELVEKNQKDIDSLSWEVAALKVLDIYQNLLGES